MKDLFTVLGALRRFRELQKEELKNMHLSLRSRGEVINDFEMASLKAYENLVKEMEDAKEKEDNHGMDKS